MISHVEEHSYFKAQVHTSDGVRRFQNTVDFFFFNRLYIFQKSSHSYSIK